VNINWDLVALAWGLGIFFVCAFMWGTQSVCIDPARRKALEQAEHKHHDLA
jgi:hypothetical protein